MKKLISFLLRYVPRKYLQRISGIGFKVLSIAYRGNKVTCPICNHSFREFLPYGRLAARPNALCPSCQALERHRLIWLYLERTTNFFNKKLKVLHIAPEACFIKRFEKAHGEGYITADIESPLAKVKMDIHEIPFAENTFDVVFCNHVLEHVQDDIRALTEIRRVLRPQGFAILQVPFFSPIPDVTFEDASITDPRQREKVFGQDDHVRLYGKDYPQRIERTGLKVVADDFVLKLQEQEKIRYALPATELIYKAVKQ